MKDDLKQFAGILVFALALILFDLYLVGFFQRGTPQLALHNPEYLGWEQLIFPFGSFLMSLGLIFYGIVKLLFGRHDK